MNGLLVLQRPAASNTWGPAGQAPQQPYWCKLGVEVGVGGWEWDLTSPPGGSDASPSLTTSALKCKLHEDRIFVGPITPEPPGLAYYRHPSHLQALNKYF